MVRDANGYTALLKAASMGKAEIVELLIEEFGVDPRHKDPFGNTSSEKALLYNRYKLSRYLKSKEE